MAAPPPSDIFLRAWHDPHAGLKCLSQTLALVDVAGDNDVRLLAADQDQRLRVYRGASACAYARGATRASR